MEYSDRAEVAIETYDPATGTNAEMQKINPVRLCESSTAYIRISGRIKTKEENDAALQKAVELWEDFGQRFYRQAAILYSEAEKAAVVCLDKKKAEQREDFFKYCSVDKPLAEVAGYIRLFRPDLADFSLPEIIERTYIDEDLIALQIDALKDGRFRVIDYLAVKHGFADDKESPSRTNATEERRKRQRGKKKNPARNPLSIQELQEQKTEDGEYTGFDIPDRQGRYISDQLSPEEYDQLVNSVKELTPRQAQYVKLKYRGLNLREIAKERGISFQSVHEAYTAGIKKMRNSPAVADKLAIMQAFRGNG